MRKLVKLAVGVPAVLLILLMVLGGERIKTYASWMGVMKNDAIASAESLVPDKTKMKALGDRINKAVGDIEGHAKTVARQKAELEEVEKEVVSFTRIVQRLEEKARDVTLAYNSQSQYHKTSLSDADPKEAECLVASAMGRLKAAEARLAGVKKHRDGLQSAIALNRGVMQQAIVDSEIAKGELAELVAALTVRELDYQRLSSNSDLAQVISEIKDIKRELTIEINAAQIAKEMKGEDLSDEGQDCIQEALDRFSTPPTTDKLSVR